MPTWSVEVHTLMCFQNWNLYLNTTSIQNLYIPSQNLHIPNKNLYILRPNLHISSQNLHILRQNIHIPNKNLCKLLFQSNKRFNWGLFTRTHLLYFEGTLTIPSLYNLVTLIPTGFVPLISFLWNSRSTTGTYLSFQNACLRVGVHYFHISVRWGVNLTSQN